MDDLLPVQDSSFELSPEPGGVTEQTLRGEVEKVLYENEETSYTVVIIRDALGELHNAVGTLPGVSAGQGVEAVGRWEVHKEYGRQFRVLSYNFTLPVTAEGIIKYLSSGVIKGLGRKNAEAIVAAFGAATLDVIENAPARLREVPGIGKKRIDAIRQIWKENAQRRTLQIHLQSYGVSLAYFTKIYQKYGDAAAEKIKENPYALATDIPGIGFVMADHIAEKMGIQKNDPKRLTSGMTYVLFQMRGLGHICVPRDLFLSKASELLGIEPGDSEKALTLAVGLMLAAIRKASDGTEMIYEPGLLRCEEEFPVRIARLMAVPRHYGQNIMRFPVQPHAIFSDEQLNAVKMVGNSPVSIITGGPGVGKTTVVGEIVRRAKLAKLTIALCAPTGRAAKRMSETTHVTAFTIHRLLKWDPAKHQFVHGRSSPLKAELIIIDETSMLDILIATALFRAINPGTTVVLVGDADQLPSVGPGNVLNDLIASGFIPVTRLTKIFRQGAGSGIIMAAHDVNSGRMPPVSRTRRNAPVTDFYWIEKDDPDEAADVIRRLVCDRIPNRFGLNAMNDIQVLSPMNKGSCGTVALNAALQELLNPEAKLQFRHGERLFKLGDKVMQISNNYDKGVFNGDMGRICAINYTDKQFSVKFDSESITYEFLEADQLSLSYAVTIHKSQGSEFPAVVIPLLTQHFVMLQRNLLYTGMTRAKRLMILIGSEKAVGMAVRNSVREPRYSLLNERLADAFRREGFG